MKPPRLGRVEGERPGPSDPQGRIHDLFGPASAGHVPPSSRLNGKRPRTRQSQPTGPRLNPASFRKADLNLKSIPISASGFTTR